MADRQKLIAVCLSQVHNFLNTEFLNELSRAAAAEDHYEASFQDSREA